MRKEKNGSLRNCTSNAEASTSDVMSKLNNLSMSLGQQPTNQSQAYPAQNQNALTNLLVLNEVVIDRGPSPYLSNIDLYLDGKLITSVQGECIYKK